MIFLKSLDVNKTVKINHLNSISTRFRRNDDVTVMCDNQTISVYKDVTLSGSLNVFQFIKEVVS